MFFNWGKKAFDEIHNTSESQKAAGGGAPVPKGLLQAEHGMGCSRSRLIRCRDGQGAALGRAGGRDPQRWFRAFPAAQGSMQTPGI